MRIELSVTEDTHNLLCDAARRRGIPMERLLHEQVQRTAREEFFHQFNEAYARLRADPEAWAEILEERREWDCTLMDGLEDEPPWED